MHQFLLALVALTVFTGRAQALDITLCNTTVPPGEVGVLRADLVCTNGQYAVYLQSHAKLEMNGHSMSAAPTIQFLTDGIGCNDTCSVLGPGEISGFEYAISTNSGLIRASNVDVHDCENGIAAPHVRVENVTSNHNLESGLGGISVKAKNVTANDNGEYGFYGGRLAAKGLTMNGNGEHGIVAVESFRGTAITLQNNTGAAVVGGRVSASWLVATGNGEGGVSGSTVTLRDSTVTGNDPFDVGSSAFPTLRRTICDHSVKRDNPPNTWGVCAQD